MKSNHDEVDEMFDKFVRCYSSVKNIRITMNHVQVQQVLIYIDMRKMMREEKFDQNSIYFERTDIDPF